MKGNFSHLDFAFEYSMEVIGKGIVLLMDWKSRFCLKFCVLWRMILQYTLQPLLNLNVVFAVSRGFLLVFIFLIYK